MIECRGRVHAERAASHLLQGDMDKYVEDWESALATVEGLLPRLEGILGHEALAADSRQQLTGIRDFARDTEMRAFSALGLHFLMQGDKARARAHLERALELIPATDPRRKDLAECLELARE